jgi:Ca2+-binding RTX toxin-like protein
MATPYNYVYGTPGDDDLSGTSGKDYFELQQGGNDNVQGLDGDDVFAFRNSLTAADTVDGGTGNDTILLHGAAYSDGLTLGDDTLTSVEKIQVGAGYSYSLTTVDANVAAGDTLIVDAVSLQSNDSLIFNGSAETDGSFRFIGGEGVNEFTGGANKDVFILKFDGAQDIVHGGSGNDNFYMDGTLAATDQIDGGTGNDLVVLQGIDGVDTLTMNATTLNSVETLYLAHGYDYGFVENDGNVAAHATLTVEDDDQDPGANQLYFDGSAETDGHFNFKPELSNATLIGGAQSDRFNLQTASNDTVTGGGGGDLIIANPGGSNDTFIYNAASDSTGVHYDTIQNMNFTTDTITVPWGDITINGDYSGMHISRASFTSDISTYALDQPGHTAIIYEATAGTLAGHAFLVVDLNGVAGYQAGEDLVIDVTGFTGVGK